MQKTILMKYISQLIMMNKLWVKTYQKEESRILRKVLRLALSVLILSPRRLKHRYHLGQRSSKSFNLECHD